MFAKNKKKQKTSCQNDVFSLDVAFILITFYSSVMRIVLRIYSLEEPY